MDMKRYVLLGLAVVLSQVGMLGQVQVDAGFDSSRILIGDQVKLHLKVADLGLNMRDLKTTLLDSTKGLEILEKGAWTQMNVDGNRFWQRDLTVTAWDTGAYVIPPIGVGFQKAGQTGFAETRPIPLRVDFPSGVDTLKTISPIRDIKKEPMQWEDALTYIFIGIGLVSLALLSYFLYKRWRNRKKPPVSKVVYQPPHVIAALKLEQLQKARLWQQGQAKEYQSELSHIVREYLEGRYKIPALESVTDDLMRDIHKLGLGETQIDHLEDILHTSDLAKFAKVVPPEETHERLMRYAMELVEKTKPEEIIKKEE